MSLVVGRAIAETVAGCPYVNEVLVYDATRRERTLRGKLKFLQRLRRSGFDLSVDLQNSRLTHGLAWLAGIPLRIGYDRRWGRLLNRAVPLPRTAMDPVSHQHYLLNAVGIGPDGEALELWPSEADDQHVEQLLRHAGIDPSKPLVGIHPGGSNRWKTKRWDLTRWAALCDHLAAKDVQVVVTGGAAEMALGEHLLQCTRSHPLLAIGNTTLMQFACLIRRCQVFVSNDSAPLHIATAMRTPTIALFGPTDPLRHAARSATVRVIKKDVFCSPCYSTWCRTITHACMKRIRAEEVAQAVDHVLGQERGRGTSVQHLQETEDTRHETRD